MKKLILVFIFLVNIGLTGKLFAQEDNRVNIVGRDLFGEEINGESVRRVEGDVVITQGNVRITCNKAIQFITRNDFELIGNVVIKRDTITLYTQKGFYNGNQKIAYSNDKIKLDDTHLTLTSEIGTYLMNLDKAEFKKNVVVYDKKMVMNADFMDYYEKDNNVIAFRNVKAKDSSSIFYCDSLIYKRTNQNTKGFKDILIVDNDNNVKVSGQEFENIRDKKYYRITGQPYMIQIDTAKTKDNTTDTLLVKSVVMELYNDSSRVFIATDSVEIVRENFSSVTSKSTFYDKDDRIFTYKNEKDERPPLMWYEGSQLTGDTINIYLDEKKLKQVDINNNALILSQNKDFPERFDQMSGDSMKMYFADNELKKTDIFRHVLSIYYAYEDEKGNGLIKSSADRATIIFEEKKVADVKFYSSVESEYHPENLIKGNEKDFTIPGFIIYNNKPDKDKLFRHIRTKLRQYNE